MRISIVLSGLMVLLSACATPEQRAAFKEHPVEALAPQYGPECNKLGHATGSASWRDCILRSSREDQLTQSALFYDRYMQWYWFY